MLNTPPKISEHHGMTLIEVMLVLIIIGIVASMSLSWLNTFYLRNQNDLRKSQLLTTLQFARLQSRAKHLPVALCKSKNHRTCGGDWSDGQLIFLDTKRDGIVHTKEQILAVMQTKFQPGTLHWRSYPHYRDYLLFMPMGLASNDNATFWYCHKQNETPAWAIILSRSGVTRVVEPDKNGEVKDSHGKALSCVESKA